MTDMLCKNNIWAPKSLSLSTCITSVIICVITCIGNGLIITTVYKDPLKKLRTPFNFFLVNLSVADLIVGAVTMPISAYGHYQEYTGYMDSIIAKLIHLSSLISGDSEFVESHGAFIGPLFCSRQSHPVQKKVGFLWNQCVVSMSALDRVRFRPCPPSVHMLHIILILIFKCSVSFQTHRYLKKILLRKYFLS